MFNVRQPIAMLMACYRQFAQSSDSSKSDIFRKVLKAVVMISFRYNVICNLQTQNQEQIYNQVAYKIEFVKRRRNWAADRVYVFDGDGELLSLPVEWTDLAAQDPFVVVAAGRSPFRTQDLLELAGLVQVLGQRRDGSDGQRTGVERITP